MLGLGSALTTGSAHEQLYSLLLDGTGDLLNTPSSIEGTNFPVTGTVSLWVTGDFTTQGTSNSVFDFYATSRNNLFIRGTDAGGTPKLQIRAQDDGGGSAAYVAGNQITVLDNQWNHIVVTWDTGAEEFKIYLNGNTTPVSSTTISDADWTPDGQLCTIGVGWLGSIDDVAIWNAVLDADAVAAVYNSGKPFDLNYDRGNYDNASDLQAYWRMFNGTNDDKVNGVVMDQNAATIGPNLITESSFETTDDWVAVTASGSTSAVSTDIAHTNASSWKVTVDGTDTDLGVQQVITVEVDTVYRADVWCYAHADNNADIAMNIKRKAGNAIVFLGETTSYFSKSIPRGAWTLLTGYFITAASNTSLTLKFGQGGASGAADDIFYVDDVTLVKIGGNPAITAADATFSTDTPDD